MDWMSIGLIALAYLLGSLSSAIMVCKLMGLPDPRSEGSGKPGATNVLRIGGKKAAAITLFGDMLKGLLPVLLAHALAVEHHTLAAVGAAAFLGHLYPVFFRFQGGKGVATMLGVMFGFHWGVGLATALTWLIMARVFKISSLSALVATLLAPVFVWKIMGALPVLIATTAAMTALLYWRHRSNIMRLIKGDEGMINKS
ncbi:MAG: glycerol-3-phosphate 1-O-acyltransferase PlsY [Gammaproteobacteria bacterium]